MCSKCLKIFLFFVKILKFGQKMISRDVQKVVDNFVQKIKKNNFLRFCPRNWQIDFLFLLNAGVVGRGCFGLKWALIHVLQIVEQLFILCWKKYFRTHKWRFRCIWKVNAGSWEDFDLKVDFSCFPVSNRNLQDVGYKKSLEWVHSEKISNIHVLQMSQNFFIFC